MAIENMDLRNAILYKLNGSTTNDLRETIVDAIESRDEKTLPGLGVLFEVLWQNSSAETQNQILSTLSDHL